MGIKLKWKKERCDDNSGGWLETKTLIGDFAIEKAHHSKTFNLSWFPVKGKGSVELETGFTTEAKAKSWCINYIEYHISQALTMRDDALVAARK